MIKLQLAAIFYNMMLNFVKTEPPEHGHWKIPGEEHVIRIIAERRICIISISKYKGQTPVFFGIDEGILEIQKIIQKQFDRMYDTLYSTSHNWYTNMEIHYLKQWAIDTKHWYNQSKLI